MIDMTAIQELDAPTTGLVRATDRCDRCNAEARVRVVMVVTRLPLLFCGHHYNGQQDALGRVAIVTHDERA